MCRPAVRVGGTALVFALAAGLSMAPAGASSGPAGPQVVAAVRLLLTTAVELPAASRAALIEEVDGIWRRAGFQPQWDAAPGLVPASRPPLRVLVMMRAARDRHASWPVAELLPAQDNRQVAIASIDGARRVLDAAGFRNDTLRVRDHRLGVILGRAVAHEIGHYLLRTTSHARSGLMRTRVDAREFADLRDGGFYLDRTSALLFQPAARTALR